MRWLLPALALTACTGSPDDKRCEASRYALLLVEVGMPDTTTADNARKDHAALCAQSKKD